MKIKNTKNFIDFCNEIGLKTFFSDIPVKKFNYNINNNALRKKIIQIFLMIIKINKNY